jgi:hypothetical protein
MILRKHVLVAALAVVSLTGCATPFRAPADVAHVKLDRINSPVVIVEKIWLERKNGELVVKGFITKQPGVSDTTQTHLDVILYDEAGRVLRRSVEHFEPRQIRRLQNDRLFQLARYSVTLDPLPAGTSRIEIRAHEGDHPDRN